MSNAKSKYDKTARLRSLIVTECGFKVTSNENYLKRLENLRKELNYINDTDWMYEPVKFKSMKNWDYIFQFERIIIPNKRKIRNTQLLL